MSRQQADERVAENRLGPLREARGESQGALVAELELPSLDQRGVREQGDVVKQIGGEQ